MFTQGDFVILEITENLFQEYKITFQIIVKSISILQDITFNRYSKTKASIMILLMNYSVNKFSFRSHRAGWPTLTMPLH